MLILDSIIKDPAAASTSVHSSSFKLREAQAHSIEDHGAVKLSQQVRLTLFRDLYALDWHINGHQKEPASSVVMRVGYDQTSPSSGLRFRYAVSVMVPPYSISAPAQSHIRQTRLRSETYRPCLLNVIKMSLRKHIHIYIYITGPDFGG